MHSLVLILLFLSELVWATDHSEDCEDYYWRDYYGVIPEDAISAGNDSYGNLLYVGQVYIKDFELLPATIVPNEYTAVTSAFGHVIRTTKHVQILCSPHKEAFEWVFIHSQDLHLYTKKNLVVGGSEVGESLYVGRTFQNDEAIVGKVFRHGRSNKGLSFRAGKSTAISLTYEVLLYNCDQVK